MPPTFRSAVIKTLGGHQRLGLHFDRARHVNTAVGVGIWVVRGNGITCIFEANRGASSCAGDAYVVRQGLELVLGQGTPLPHNRGIPGHFLALGIAPDSVKAVRLKVVGDKSITVPVIKDAYGLRAGAPINREVLIR
jgi:hypothetical protein